MMIIVAVRVKDGVWKRAADYCHSVIFMSVPKTNL